MASLEVVRSELADSHKDTRLNLQGVLEGGSLTAEQRWGVAVACAFAVRNERLKEAMLNEAKKALANPEPVIEDARAAASLMASGIPRAPVDGELDAFGFFAACETAMEHRRRERHCRHTHV